MYSCNNTTDRVNACVGGMDEWHGDGDARDVGPFYMVLGVLLLSERIMMYSLMVHGDDGDGGVDDLSSGDADEILSNIIIMVITMTMLLSFRVIHYICWLCC